MLMLPSIITMGSEFFPLNEMIMSDKLVVKHVKKYTQFDKYRRKMLILIFKLEKD